MEKHSKLYYFPDNSITKALKDPRAPTKSTSSTQWLILANVSPKRQISPPAAFVVTPLKVSMPLILSLDQNSKNFLAACSSFVGDAAPVCPLQVQICKRSVEVMDAVRRGAQLAIDECQFQFRNRRWNCSTLESMPVFGKVVTQGKIIHCSDSRRHFNGRQH